MGHRFIGVLATEWRGILNQKCNFKIPLVFYHVVVTRTLSARKTRDTQARFDRRLDLWERVIHAGLVWDTLTEGRDREGRARKAKKRRRIAWSAASTAP